MSEQIKMHLYINCTEKSLEDCGFESYPQRLGLETHPREIIGGTITTAEVLKGQVLVSNHVFES